MYLCVFGGVDFLRQKRQKRKSFLASWKNFYHHYLTLQHYVVL